MLCFSDAMIGVAHIRRTVLLRVHLGKEKSMVQRAMLAIKQEYVVSKSLKAHHWNPLIKKVIHSNGLCKKKTWCKDCS